MKTIKIILLAASTVILAAGCSSTPLAVSPVGPNPLATPNLQAGGRLEVFSALEAKSEGDTPAWAQHSDYNIFSQQHKLLKSVINAAGQYGHAPEIVSLPPGTYFVKARSTDFFTVEIPVVVRQGELTRVYLDDSWTPAAAGSSAKLVALPNGQPVGWQLSQAK